MTLKEKLEKVLSEEFELSMGLRYVDYSLKARFVWSHPHYYNHHGEGYADIEACIDDCLRILSAEAKQSP